MQSCPSCNRNLRSSYPNYCPYCGNQLPQRAPIKPSLPKIIEHSLLRYSYYDVSIAAQENSARRCKISESASVCLEPENEYDPNAVAVYSVHTMKLGYLYKGKLQSMVHDYINKDYTILANIVENNITENKVVIALFFYKPIRDDEIIKTFTITVSESRYEKIMSEGCYIVSPVGDEVQVEYDYDKLRYRVEDFGLLPQKAEEYASGSYAFFIMDDTENDNGGHTLKFGIVEV